MIPGTDDSEAEEAVRSAAAQRCPCAHTGRCCLQAIDDSADQRAWSRQEDFLILAVASQLGNKPVRAAPLSKKTSIEQNALTRRKLWRS